MIIPAPSRYLLALLLALAGGTAFAAVSADRASAATVATPPATALDRVIVIVNDDVITESELKNRLVEARQQLTRRKIALPPEDVLRRQLLERMTIERLQLQIASRRGITVTNAEVDRAIDRIASRQNLNVEQLLARFKQDGIDPKEFRGEVQNQLTIQRLIDREVTNRVTVTDAEIEYVMRQLAAGGQADQEFNIAHIFITVPEAASPVAIQAARETAEKALAALSAGEPFGQVAATYSQSNDALRGGELGWRKAGQLPDIYLDALKKLEAGQTSGVLRGPNGFHIVKLIELRGGIVQKKVTQTKVRHILLKPSEIQSLAEARSKLLLLRERVANGDDFGALARAHSEDGLSAAAGGDLGWVNPKQLVPEFEQVMNELAPGQLSQPAESPFGVHLIQVMERREKDISEHATLEAARQQIHSRKAEEMYQDWVRRLRDEAYVEYLVQGVK